MLDLDSRFTKSASFSAVSNLVEYISEWAELAGRSEDVFVILVARGNLANQNFLKVSKKGSSLNLQLQYLKAQTPKVTPKFSCRAVNW